jgi:hypothetical protein
LGASLVVLKSVKDSVVRREEAREIGIVGAGAATTRKFCAQIFL